MKEQYLPIDKWNMPLLGEIPDDEKATICVLYSDGGAIVTSWLDERSEGRVKDILGWVGIPYVPRPISPDDPIAFQSIEGLFRQVIKEIKARSKRGFDL